MDPEQLRRTKRALGCTWPALARALGAHPNTIYRWLRGDLEIGSPALLDLALRQLEEHGLPRDTVTSAEIAEALAESQAMHACGASTPRLDAARAALQSWLRVREVDRDPAAAGAALQEHRAALAQAREEGGA